MWIRSQQTFLNNFCMFFGMKRWNVSTQMSAGKCSCNRIQDSALLHLEAPASHHPPRRTPHMRPPTLSHSLLFSDFHSWEQLQLPRTSVKCPLFVAEKYLSNWRHRIFRLKSWRIEDSFLQLMHPPAFQTWYLSLASVAAQVKNYLFLALKAKN